MSGWSKIQTSKLRAKKTKERRKNRKAFEIFCSDIWPGIYIEHMTYSVELYRQKNQTETEDEEYLKNLDIATVKHTQRLMGCDRPLEECESMCK